MAFCDALEAPAGETAVKLNPVGMTPDERDRLTRAEAEPKASDALHQIASHEAVCAERYMQIMSRMTRMERIMLAVAGTLLAAMAGALFKLLAVGAKLAM